ncbi:putative peptidase M16 domain-containing protein [Rosa chinensis]|uniref:Putative peptidase M16 domain-containing protein n=1 Tax=Rosa chinensis TaxID=74649 RepID=A0A2P6RYN0_ROSCH|nr:putative peptidase M16 domain-containing protein [Rosa chinensis]
MVARLVMIQKDQWDRFSALLFMRRDLKMISRWMLYMPLPEKEKWITCLNALIVVFKLMQRLYIEGLGYGNLLEEEAISLLNMVKIIFSGQPLPTKLMLKNNCICLTPDANLIRDVSVKYKTKTNSVIQLYFQIERAVGLSPPD